MYAGANLFQLPIKKTLERACDARQVDPVELVKSLGIPSDRFFKQIKHSRGPVIHDIEKVCDFFEITVDSFLSGFVDLDWIRERKIPQKYLYSPGSRIRTSMPVLEYAKQRGGERFFLYVLRTLKIPEKILREPDQMVSISLLSDIVALLSSRGWKTGNFIEMGWQAAAISQNAAIGKEFIGLTPHKVYDKLFNELTVRYETNFDYTIVRSSSNEVRVRVTAKPERVEAFGSEIIDNFHVSAYRQGVAAAHMKFAGFPIAQSRQISSVHAGDSAEEFSLTW